MAETISPRGPLLLIGGAEDKVGGKTILSRFVQLAGGPNARIAIVATASSFFDLVGQRYVSLFGALGAGHAEVVRARDRHEAQHPQALLPLENATGIFITGGDQLKLTAVLGGTAVARLIKARNLAGAVVAGTSAGASVSSEHMLAYGASGAPPRKDMMQFAPGFGLISGVVVDQHFGARGRTGRLLTAVAHNPALLGIGLDEDTAAEITATGLLTVYGRSAVMVVDGSEITLSDIHRVGDTAPLTIFNVRVHVLAAGYRFDLPTRTPLEPSDPIPIHEDITLVNGEGI